MRANSILNVNNMDRILKRLLYIGACPCKSFKIPFKILSPLRLRVNQLLKSDKVLLTKHSMEYNLKHRG